jgi:o-succinylbenzoate synthase
LHHKDSLFIFLHDDSRPEITGTGECSVIPNLSIDALPDLESHIKNFYQQINTGSKIEELDFSDFPAVKFAFETALLDLKNKGEKILFPSDFTKGKDSIPINGLIWMGEINMMMTQLRNKIDNGFKCIKIKVGAIDFEEEISLLKEIRKNYSQNDVVIRLDANGAFTPENANWKLEELEKYDIHSIEQPIKQGNPHAMAKLCETTPIPIALDEELIGVHDLDEKKHLLELINPQYIILKPSLLGGFKASEVWISIADKLNVGWWITSALESNVGLSAIAQWTYKLNKKIYHGLGTGQIYTNNISSPLYLQGENLFFDPGNEWANIIDEN